MRIFLTLHPSANRSVNGSMTWLYNLYEPLIENGHDVVLLRLDQIEAKFKVSVGDKRFKDIYSEELIKIFREEHSSKPFDFFLSYLTDRDIHVESLKCIRVYGVPMANFSCNNTHQFHLINQISGLFDYNLHSEKDAAAKFREINANPVWFPMAANPRYYYPLRIEQIYDVSFIGAAYAKRAYYISHLVNSGILINCFGPNWLVNKPYSSIKKIKKELVRISWLLQSLGSLTSSRYQKSFDIFNYDLLINVRKQNLNRMHYPCNDKERIEIINKSKINLGFLEVYSDDLTHNVNQHLHLREFEIPMCGGLYITNFSDELVEFYEPDKEIITFRNEHELLDKIKYYLIHDKEANIVRKAAYNRAIECHTYHRRFSDLFSQLRIK